MTRDEIGVRKREDADELHREWLAPDATTLWVDLVYRLLLGRPAEGEALLGSWRSLVLESGSRRALVQEIVASREFAEAALIERLIQRVASGEDWRALLTTTDATTERVVEIPWVLSRLSGNERVLDIGTRHAFDAYTTGLLRLNEFGTVVGLDLVMTRVHGLLGIAADACRLPFPDGSFSFVSCISTIEHIGHDNARYGNAGGGRSATAAAALAEFARVLDANGRIAVTVPFGRAEYHGWFEQFDEAGWRELVRSAGVSVVEEETFALAPRGWTRVDPRSALVDASYGDRGPAASAVRCALLRRG
jgi:SAM-dependent methyltransferase